MKNKKIIPIWLLVCASFLFMYLLLFVQPVFLNISHSMLFPKYVLSMNPIGIDLRQMLSYSSEWVKGCTPYVGANLYPPFASVLFYPLTTCQFPTAYFLVTFMTIAAFISVVLVLPLVSCKDPDRAALVALTIAGLLSYGFQFEIERGQFNTIAFALCAWAIFFFHSGQGKWARIGAFLLFTVAIQLKLYPAIFIFAFTRNARDWKGNLMRWGALGVINIALFFTLGVSVFENFLTAVTAQVNDPYVWIGNHSLTSFITLALRKTSLGPFASFIWLGCGLILAMCFLFILARVYQRNSRRYIKYLIASCGLSTMLIPSVSHDYKLPILCMIFAMFVGETRPILVNGFKGIFTVLFLFAFSMINAWSLFPYTFKPVILRNNAPFLLFAYIVLILIMLSEETQRSDDRQTGDTTAS